MHQPLFAGRRLNAAYRGSSSDFVIALLNRADDDDADPFFDSCCLHRPRRFHRMKEEEQ